MIDFMNMMTAYVAEVSVFSLVWIFGDYIIRGIISAATGKGIKIGGGGNV